MPLLIAVGFVSASFCGLVKSDFFSPLYLGYASFMNDDFNRAEAQAFDRTQDFLHDLPGRLLLFYMSRHSFFLAFD